MKRLLSYLWPFTKEVSSKINGTLELTWMNGKKVLDSQNANYSYGSLQKLLSYGLSQIDISTNSEILLLGLGGGSVIETLRNTFNHHGKITAVEIDAVIIEIAKNEFNVIENQNLEIYCEDAFSYVNYCVSQFEIIIIDIFIDNQVPEQFYENQFWKNLIPLLKPNGQILFNAGINLKENIKIESLKSMVKSDIEFSQHNQVQGINTLLIGKKRSRDKD
ncbi:spermine/spermidine synthase [Aquimarina sp. MAR_2010_214]|uniref:spermine/spermidine synthase domain-containing protein n=1 Tax=Aquimarina sp. MAR_2010_214 TaxID=1250026 RepID=UPI000C705CE9|nr:methyltransferase domain-containing protein [Aquimarina sp. MAR_2010_214]PKV51862.1 spermine/spermidine synthase [Aquimarina sp. MAR_2010_214]